MFQLTPHSAERIGAFIQQQAELPFSYEAVGATHPDHEAAPARRVVDHNRVLLGSGDACFACACDALREWRMFPSPWTRIHPAKAPISEGQAVVIQIHAFGLWSLNAARIVYTIDRADEFGFAYGTLPGHAESGEERFMIRRNAAGEVFYDLFAFSRPRHFFTIAGFPVARYLQKRFARESLESMRQAVADFTPQDTTES